LHAGAQWAKLRKASGHRYPSESVEVLSDRFGFEESLSAVWPPAAFTPSATSGEARFLPGCLCTSACVPGYVGLFAEPPPCWQLRDTQICANSPACVGKVSGWAGRLRVSSPGTRRQQDFLAHGWLPVSSSLPDSPFSPRPRTRCRGLRAGESRREMRQAAEPRSLRRARPRCARGPWVSRRPCALPPGRARRDPEALASSQLRQGLQSYSDRPGSAHAGSQRAATCSRCVAGLKDVGRG
jgi:hypothetical protein